MQALNLLQSAITIVSHHLELLVVIFALNVVQRKCCNSLTIEFNRVTNVYQPFDDHEFQLANCHQETSKEISDNWQLTCHFIHHIAPVMENNMRHNKNDIELKKSSSYPVRLLPLL